MHNLHNCEALKHPYAYSCDRKAKGHPCIVQKLIMLSEDVQACIEYLARLGLVVLRCAKPCCGLCENVRLCAAAVIVDSGVQRHELTWRRRLRESI